MKGGVIEKILLIAFLAVIVLLVLTVATDSDCTRACLEHGWASSNITLPDLTCFCIREENEYEIVRSLEDILAQQ